MTLRPEYALGHSELNPFLFAAVGNDGGGQELTVLSVLARLGLDPWAEAARLSNLPRDAAAQALAVLLRKADRKTPDTDDIAARLVACLPRNGAPPIPVQRTAAVVEKARSRPSMWLVYLAVAITLFFVLSYLKADPNLEQAPSVVTSK